MDIRNHRKMIGYIEFLISLTQKSYEIWLEQWGDPNVPR